MSWSQEQVRTLIELYKKHPCLYAIKSPQYKKKHARNNTLEVILNELKCIRPSVTAAEIKSNNIINNLRTNFLAEHRKHLNYYKVEWEAKR